MAPYPKMHLARLALLMSVLTSPALGLTQPCYRIPPASLARPVLSLSKTDGSDVSRAEFVQKIIGGSVVALAPDVAKAFDGGVGGLGMEKFI